jgi:hydrogenase expression/formation protein HypE
MTPLTRAALETGHCRFIRDATRGGVAAVLREIAESGTVDVIVYPEKVPVHPDVLELTDLLGLDPLSMANEGKVVLSVESKYCENVLRVLQSHPLGRASAIIGEIKEGGGNVYAGKEGRLALLEERPFGAPRIC